MNIFPYLTFNGNCQEALTFYAEIFDGTIEGMMPWPAEMIADTPGATVEHIMHGAIDINGSRIVGIDQFGDMYSAEGSNSIMIDIDDIEKAKTIFDSLAADGEVMMPFGEQFWTQGYGFCRDRFGTAWQINSTGNAGM